MIVKYDFISALQFEVFWRLNSADTPTIFPIKPTILKQFRAYSRKIWPLSNISQKGHFFLKKKAPNILAPLFSPFSKCFALK